MTIRSIYHRTMDDYVVIRFTDGRDAKFIGINRTQAQNQFLPQLADAAVVEEIVDRSGVGWRGSVDMVVNHIFPNEDGTFEVQFLPLGNEPAVISADELRTLLT